MFPNYYAQENDEPMDDEIETSNEEESEEVTEAGEDVEEDEPPSMTGPSKPRNE